MNLIKHFTEAKVLYYYWAKKAAMRTARETMRMVAERKDKPNERA